jgi:Cas7 group CRISPR-associated protein Csh2
MLNKRRRGEGVIIVEATLSNINGDPKRGGEPRTFNDYGLASDCSLSRKLRDVVCPGSPVREEIFGVAKVDPASEGFDIFERPEVGVQKSREIINKEGIEAFHKRFWDARLWGNTLLEEKMDKGSIRTGVFKLSIGMSVAPVEIIIGDCTRKAPTEEGKSCGMAPDKIKVIRHGIYCFPFSIEFFRMDKNHTCCTQQDIDILLSAIPYAYLATASSTRTDVRIVSAPYVEFNGLGLNLCNLRKSFYPIKRVAQNISSVSIQEYEFPGLNNSVVLGIQEKYPDAIAKLIDLCPQEVML